MKYNPISRRMFLQGMGGYALTIPLLQSLLPREAQAQAAASNLRFAYVHSPLGRDITTWYPKLEDAQMTYANGVYSKALADIQGDISYSFSSAYNNIRSKIAILRGLDSMNAISQHNTSLGLTGCSSEPNTDIGFGYSLDCILEESKIFYPKAPMLGALRVSPHNSYPWSWSHLSYTSKTVRGQNLPVEWNAQKVYNSLLNPANVQLLASKNEKIMGASNLVYENFKKTMNGRRIGAEDKARLDQYMQLISEVDQALAAPIVSCNGVNDPGQFTKPSDFHKAMFKMEAAALSCGSTKISIHAIVHCDDQIENQEWHGHAHGGTTDVNPNTGRSYQADYSKFAMDQVAYFLNLLDSIPDVNGSLLDNTFFLYSNEDGTGGHQHIDLPVMVAGAKGKLRTGFMYDYRPRPLLPLDQYTKTLYFGRPYNNVLITAFRSMGLAPNDYQRQGLPGFGRYDQFRSDLGAHYAPFLGSKVNDPLPMLFTG